MNKPPYEIDYAVEVSSDGEDQLYVDVYVKPVVPIQYITIPMPKPDGLTDAEWLNILQELIDKVIDMGEYE